MAHISVTESSPKILSTLEDLNTEHLIELNVMDIHQSTKIFFNGSWIGIHNDANYLVNTLVSWRRCGDIPKQVSIVRDIPNREIKIYSDSGRVQRPLFIVEDNTLTIKQNHIDRMKLPRDHE